MQHDLKNIDLWRLSLGLYPVPLFSDENRNDQFVLLNGNRGNFCLDLTNEPLGSESRNRAWSSDVGHYVALINQHIEVQRWDQRIHSVDRYLYDSVSQDLEKFHARLERDQPKRDLSIVSHVIRVFRSLRAALGTSVDGPTSLKAFLYLLACVADDVGRAELHLRRWHLDESAGDIASAIPAIEWQSLLDELILGRHIEGLTPNPTLFLRHASGQIFQEAHYEAVAIPQEQLMLQGFTHAPLTLSQSRKGTGLHFTPPALARTLVEEALESIGDLPAQVRIFDPACGSGEFLRETLRQLKLKHYNGKIELVGWDISRAACDMATFVLAWERRGRENEVTISIRCTDSIINEQWPDNVTLTIMNPPFVSWRDMNLQQRDSLEKVLGKLSKQRPDLSSGFIWKAASTLPVGGVLASILPASFLDGESSERIRGALSDIVSTKLVARLGSHQLFSTARVDAAFYVCRVNGGGPPAVAFWADHKPQSTSAGLRTLRMLRNNQRESAYPVIREGFSIYRNPELGRNELSWAPRPFRSWQLLNRLEFLPRVKSLFDVKQGVLTGNNKVFVLSKDEWERLSRPERSYFRPALLNESIIRGALVTVGYVFYPYGNKTIETEEQLNHSVKNYYEETLLPNKDVLINRSNTVLTKWWELTRHRNWLEEAKPKIVSTYFGDAGSFAWDSTGAFVVLQGYGWLHRPMQAFKDLPENVGLAYIALLNSTLFSKLLSATSNHVGGGQWNLSKRFVDKLPLPNLLSGNIHSDEILELAIIGKEIQAGRPIDTQGRDELVKAVYGVEENL